jgi:NADH-quinone oxidoreductase subunit D
MITTENDVYSINFGPHHPSTHGILRLKLKLSEEMVTECDPDIGYLHRGVEKIVESKKFMSIIPYIDRLDYLSPANQEHAYVMAIERLLAINPSPRSVFIRTIFDELTRISSHIMGIGSATYDIGCLSLFLYGFEEREKIMDIFKAVTGARMHLSYYVPGGVLNDISDEVVEQILNFINGIGFYMRTVEKFALNNRIFAKRTKGIGVISAQMAKNHGISGVNLRASGVSYDVRKSSPYGAYDDLNFKPLILFGGDCYDRINLRFLEIWQSIDIIRQCLSDIPKGVVRNYGYFNNFVPQSSKSELMESYGRPSKTPERGTVSEMMYSSFFADGLQLPSNSIVYAASETPRGEFGVHMIVGHDRNRPLRLHFKSPSFAHIQLLKSLLVGVQIADITAILGSLDFIIGCCDR